MGARINNGEMGKVTIRQRGGSFGATATMRHWNGTLEKVYGSGPSEAEATENIEREFRVKIGAKVGLITADSTMDELIDAWFAHSKSGDLGAGTMKTYKSWGPSLKAQLAMFEKMFGKKFYIGHSAERRCVTKEEMSDG